MKLVMASAEASICDVVARLTTSAVIRVATPTATASAESSARNGELRRWCRASLKEARIPFSRPAVIEPGR